MKPRVLILFLLAAVCAGSDFAWGQSGKPTVERPNVLFLAVDDMKDWVGCLGGYEGTVHTPNIDRLAARGVLFTNAHCPSPKCAPSRAAIMTGLMPSTTGLYENSHWWKPNLPEVVSLPAQFKAHGYRVAGAGKIFHHTAGNNPPGEWDEFRRLIFRNDGWFREKKINYPWSTPVPFPEGFPFSEVEGLPHENDWGALPGVPEADYDDTLSADFAVEFLRTHEPDQPFFLACGLFRPHLPWYVPREYFDLYPLDEIVLPEVREGDLDDVPEVGRQLALAGHSDFEKIRDADRWKHAIQAYLASISYADAQLGRVLEALDISPHAENTYVTLWSDHGWHLGEKGHWHKSTLWEEATRVPFLFAGPGIEPAKCDRPVSLISLFPTLNDLCGLPLIENHDGVSLRPLLEDPASASWGRPAVIEYLLGNAAVRSDRFRYIRYHDGSEELYDHETDPHEWDNLAKNPEQASVIANLARWLPENWAPEAKAKGAFQFDPETWTWREKKTNRVIEGR
ncbi:MAG: sulfatase [Verrucomicrobiae bacterium]|nr:sulfatase [Verrucomicrobiae bacterium]